MSRIVLSVGPKLAEFTDLQDVKENIGACLRQHGVRHCDLLLVDRQDRICDDLPQLERAEAEGALPIIAFKKVV